MTRGAAGALMHVSGGLQRGQPGGNGIFFCEERARREPPAPQSLWVLRRGRECAAAAGI